MTDFIQHLGTVSIGDAYSSSLQLAAASYSFVVAAYFVKQ